MNSLGEVDGRMVGRCQRFTGVNHSRNVTSFHDIVLGSYIYWHNMALLIMHLHLLQAAECDSSSLPSQCHLDILPSQACCSQYQWPGHATGCSYVTMIYGQVYVFDALLIEDIHDKKHPCISINLWSYPPSFTLRLHKISHLFSSMSLFHHQTAKDKLHTSPIRDIDWGFKKSEFNVI